MLFFYTQGGNTKPQKIVWCGIRHELLLLLSSRWPPASFQSSHLQLSSSWSFDRKKKLSDPYRRIIFGMSSFDILLSLALVFRIFMTTPEQSNALLAIGNQTSCNALGFMKIAGINGALFFNLSLNVYYLCLVRYNMAEMYYRNRVEPLIHAVPISFALISSSIIVRMGHINPGYQGECALAHFPLNCQHDPNVDCDRGKFAHSYRLLFLVIPRLVAIAGILITLAILCWYVQSQEKKDE